MFAITVKIQGLRVVFSHFWQSIFISAWISACLVIEHSILARENKIVVRRYGSTVNPRNLVNPTHAEETVIRGHQPRGHQPNHILVFSSENNYFSDFYKAEEHCNKQIRR